MFAVNISFLNTIKSKICLSSSAPLELNENIHLGYNIYLNK